VTQLALDEFLLGLIMESPDVLDVEARLALFGDEALGVLLA